MAKIYNLARGSSVVDEILKIAGEEEIKTASVIGTGRVMDLVLLYYNDESREYEEHSFEGGFEVVSLIGNLTLTEGKPILHAHGTFASRDMSVLGGHLKSATVSPVLEVVINPTSNVATRGFDSSLRLNIIRGIE